MSLEGCDPLPSPDWFGLYVTLVGRAGATASLELLGTSAELSSPEHLGPLAYARIALSLWERVEPPKSVALGAVAVECPGDGASAPAERVVFRADGCVLYDIYPGIPHTEARVHRDAGAADACEEWEEATAEKSGRKKKYWFSLTRGASEWKEPLKYYPVTFEKPKDEDAEEPEEPEKPPEAGEDA